MISPKVIYTWTGTTVYIDKIDIINSMKFMESLRDESLQAESQFGIRLSERINYLRKVRLADQGTDIKSV